MDDETAEIELLEQNLNKTRQITQRMTSILSSFDGRLVKVDKAILPLYTSSQMLTKRANNIERALDKIYQLASSQEGTAAEEALILRGPSTDQLSTYTDALERLNAGIAFGSSERDPRDTARLIETGAKKLAQLFTKFVAEGSSGAPLAGASFQRAPFPEHLTAALVPLVTFLRSLPLPATHPSHPAASAIQVALREAQRGYADMRGNWCRKCLEIYGRRALERAETVEGVLAGRDVGKWVQSMLDVIEEEYTLLTQLVPLQDAKSLSSTFSSLLNPILLLFSTTFSSLTALIKRALHKHTFLALSAYSAISVAQARWEKLIAVRADRHENELRDALGGIKAVCLRSFPEFLADVKLASVGKTSETTGLADFTVSTVEYMKNLLEVRDAVGDALVALGDGNWKMGAGVGVAKTNKLGVGSEQILIEHYIYDVVNTVVTSLQAVSRAQPRPSVGSVYLINNIAHLRATLLDARAPVSSLLSRPTRDALQSAFRTAKAGYFDANLTPLVQALAEDPRARVGRSETKERLTRFYDLLEETKERHALMRVLEDDNEARAELVDEVVRLVIPSLQRFLQRTREKEFSKNPSKYIKMTPEEVETLIRNFY
ncbi:Cullin repeat-like-containing domain protein [Vararia minispora EC-137]|uniref:Cullin repeat-like-containing domain protein n=1 Tax=Vararia minispora EC-137 TaxID=1314806 RepID=A0ACB8QFC9_9AGAM|nr:Cullin repeat-like-containing domain protein [Vararia minispora EC-137]